VEGSGGLEVSGRGTLHLPDWRQGIDILLLVEREFFFSTVALMSILMGRGKENEALDKFFPQVCVGDDVKDPTVVLDSWGQVMAWLLPDVISSGRVVHVLFIF
jgi:hypothetical protein